MDYFGNYCVDCHSLGVVDIIIIILFSTGTLRERDAKEHTSHDRWVFIESIVIFGRLMTINSRVLACMQPGSQCVQCVSLKFGLRTVARSVS